MSRGQVGDERVKKVQPPLNHRGPEKLKTLCFDAVSGYYFPETSLHQGREVEVLGAEPAVSATGVGKVW